MIYREKIKTAAPFALFGLLVVVILIGLHPRLHTGLLAKPSLHAGDTVPATDLAALTADGTRFKTIEWRGRPYIVNFFASWCPDCYAEHEELMTLATTKIPLIGITYKDQSNKMTSFLDHSGNPYVVVGEDKDGIAEAAWQLAGVPETFVIDGKGIIRWHYAGVLTDQIVTDQLMPAWEACLGDN